MKKLMLALAAMVGSMISLPVASANAQGGELIARIPFNFIVKDKEIPAGEYRILLRGTASRVVTIQDGAGNTVATAVTLDTLASRPQAQSRLVFNRYGDTYYLSELWRQSETSGYALVRPVAEEKLARSTGLAGRSRVSINLGR
jgi:hypothetical protein